MREWSDEQRDAMKMVRTWLKNPDGKTYYLAGYAGVGKTTLSIELARGVKHLANCAFTGKAALVMESKGCRNCSTIHGLIYEIDEQAMQTPGQPAFKLRKNSFANQCDLIVVDECSMVDERMGRDLESFGVPVLVLGDPAQLPPINGTGYFTARDADFLMEQIHRQAEGSPIIELATKIRLGEKVNYFERDDTRVVGSKEAGKKQVRDWVMAADQVLVGTHATRMGWNNRIRQLHGREGPVPIPGDRLICDRNDHEIGIYNGSLWDVMDVDMESATICEMLVAPADKASGVNPRHVRTHLDFLNKAKPELDWEETKGLQRFLWGYAITCHKSQGSQWDNVVVMDESNVFREDKNKWLYTAVTRAASGVTVLR